MSFTGSNLFARLLLSAMFPRGIYPCAHLRDLQLSVAMSASTTLPWPAWPALKKETRKSVLLRAYILRSTKGMSKITLIRSLVSLSLSRLQEVLVLSSMHVVPYRKQRWVYHYRWKGGVCEVKECHSTQRKMCCLATL